ncbi:MAG: hypothetical protein ACXVFL_13095 [Solirubrobacteraceae bacterium]
MSANTLQWDGGPGHYEVYYLTLSDPRSGVGLWIRYTMLAPDHGDATCALWFVAMDRDGMRFARKQTFPIAELQASAEPFRVALAGAELTDAGMRGTAPDVAWDLAWTPAPRAAEPVHPLLRRARLARTVLLLPHPHVAVTGTVCFGERELELDAVPGGQAHLWGGAHAARWAWGHCSDFRGPAGEPRPEDWIDAVSVFLPRLGRELGPSTPVVGHIAGEEVQATGPLRVLHTTSGFGLTEWRFDAQNGNRRFVATVEAPRASLVGVTYHDPDGAPAYCYNSEVATMRLDVLHRAARGRHGWMPRETLRSDGRAHFEYAQRRPMPGLDLLIT